MTSPEITRCTLDYLRLRRRQTDGKLSEDEIRGINGLSDFLIVLEEVELQPAHRIRRRQRMDEPIEQVIHESVLLIDALASRLKRIERWGRQNNTPRVHHDAGRHDLGRWTAQEHGSTITQDAQGAHNGL